MWYTVNLLFQSVHPGQPSDQDTVWEESVFLVQAASRDEARRLGMRIGKEQETEYVSATGEEVCWKFAEVESVFEILDETVGHGVEVFSRILRARDVADLLGSRHDSSGGPSLTPAPPPSQAPSP